MNTRRKALLWIFSGSITLAANPHAQAQSAPSGDKPPPPPPGYPPLPPMPSEPQGPQPGSNSGGPSGAGNDPYAPLPHQGNLPLVANTAATRRLGNLPSVAIREFRSALPELPAPAAVDMFIAALIKTRRFRVLERSRLAQGAGAEKALSQQGMTSSTAGQVQYAEATYLFEALISGATASERRSSLTLGFAGANAGHAAGAETLTIDVRLVDVQSSIVVDAVNVSRKIKAQETQVGGLTSALTRLLTRGRGSPVADTLAPTDAYTSARKSSVEDALRAAIEEAVNTLAKRFEDG